MSRDKIAKTSESTHEEIRSDDVSKAEYAQAMVRRYQHRLAENTHFFSSYDSAIYETVKNYRIQRHKLDIRIDQDETDLIHSEGRLYDGQAKAYAGYEVEQFLKLSGPGKQVQTMEPPAPGDFAFSRYFNLTADDIVRHSPASLLPIHNQYIIGSYIPCLVFMGVGMGYHIEQLLSAVDVHRVVVYESDLDRFFASLYTVDWRSIISAVTDQSQGSEFRLILPTVDQKTATEMKLWFALIDQSPQFPLFTLFYNHLGDDGNDRLVDQFVKRSASHLITWGNYDDEVNQLNQAVYNVHQDPISLPMTLDLSNRVPICIIGAGPSLDKRLEAIREMATGAIIVACGTAINALYKEGIIPDIVAILESDYLAIDYVDLISRDGEQGQSYLKKIHLIGPIHINPNICSYFKDYRYYIKPECGLSVLLNGFGVQITGGIPTCSNLGLAFALYYQFKDIYLFGIDLGFSDIRDHHAKNTIYYQEEDQEQIHHSYIEAANYDGQMLMSDLDVMGNEIKTEPFYYTSKIYIEELMEKYLRAGEKGINLCNFSSGLAIKHSQWINDHEVDGFVKKVVTSPNAGSVKNEILDKLFSSDDTAAMDFTPDLVKLRQQLEELVLAIAAISESIIEVLHQPISTSSDLNRVSVQITLLLQKVKHDNRVLYNLTRGSVWYLLLIGLSHSFRIDTDYSDDAEACRNREQLIKHWRSKFTEFLSGWSDHFKNIVSNADSKERNQWLNLSLFDPEPKWVES